MLFLEPSPLPDESLYSLLCRAYLLDGGFTHRKTLKYIFDPMMRASDLEMAGSQAVYFWKNCLKDYWSLEQYIEEATLYRLYAPLLPIPHRKYIKKWFGRNPLSIRQLFGQNFTSESLDLYYLKYCPECILADIKEYGVTYWHRSHCCKWAFTCHRHQCELVNVGFLRSGSECFQLPDYSLGGVGKQREILIEPLIYQWLNEPCLPAQEPVAFKKQLVDKICDHFQENVETSFSLLSNNIDDLVARKDLAALEIQHAYPDGSSRPWLPESLLSNKRLCISALLLIETAGSSMW